MPQKLQKCIFYICLLITVAGAALIVWEVYQQSPNIDYDKSYNVEEVQKLVDEKS